MPFVKAGTPLSSKQTGFIQWHPWISSLQISVQGIKNFPTVSHYVLGNLPLLRYYNLFTFHPVMPFVKAVSHPKKTYLHLFVFFHHASPKQKTIHKLFAIPVSQLHFFVSEKRITTAVGHFDNGMFFKNTGIACEDPFCQGFGGNQPDCTKFPFCSWKKNQWLVIGVPFVKGLATINLTVQLFPFVKGRWLLIGFPFVKGLAKTNLTVQNFHFIKGSIFPGKKQQCKWFPFCQGSVHSFCQGVVGFCLLTRHHCTELLLFVKECLRKPFVKASALLSRAPGSGCPQ